MIRTIGIVLGVYGIVAFSVALIQLVMKLEDGLTTGEAFSVAIGSGIIWPISLIAWVVG
jgi:hypothetical protein